MKIFRRVIILAAMCILFAASARATTVTYEAAHLGGTQWRYDYSVSNDTLAVAIEEFTLFFDHALYANLSGATGAPGWDLLLIAPDAAIPAAGYFDALALAGGIAVNATRAGFSVTFDYLGAGAPVAQAFSVLDPVSFAELDNGMTVAVSAVPLPPAFMLMLAGLLLISLRLRGRMSGGRP